MHGPSMIEKKGVYSFLITQQAVNWNYAGQAFDLLEMFKKEEEMLAVIKDKQLQVSLSLSRGKFINYVLTMTHVLT